MMKTRTSKGLRAWFVLMASMASLLVAVFMPPPSPAAPPSMSRDDIICRAMSGVGFSYSWGGECWCSSSIDDCSPDTVTCDPGVCTDGTCTPGGCHTGTYGADCSGFVSKVWQVPDAHATNTCNVARYGADAFQHASAYWTVVTEFPQPGDALVQSDGGHVVLYEKGDAWGSLSVYESMNCGTGIVHQSRAFDTSYAVSRRSNLVLDYAWDLDAPQSTDVDGDGNADICARAGAGIRCYLAVEGGFGAALNGPEWSDEGGWDDIAAYATIKMGDVNGDRLDDICARDAASSSAVCWLSNGSGFPTRVDGPALSYESGWKTAKYWGTMKLADFNGDGRKDICARSAEGMVCYPSTGTGFGSAVAGPALSDESGWDAINRWATIRMGDVNGDCKEDICARDVTGMVCWLSDGEGFPRRIDAPPLSDEGFWNKQRYWSTIKLADFNGDGLKDICARGPSDFRCYPSTGSGFGSAAPLTEWSDTNGWGDLGNYGTIRMGDVNGDGKDDACARSNDTTLCWLSDGTSFSSSIDGPDLSDASGWNDVKYWSTFRLADIDGDGKADLCARAGAGIRCYLSTGMGFGDAITGPEFIDDSGWGAAQYFATIRIASKAPLCVPKAEICGDGIDNDFDGLVDEDCLPDDQAAESPDGVPDGQTDSPGDSAAADGDRDAAQGPDPDGIGEITGGCGCAAAR